MRKISIKGIGVISNIGNSPQTVWEGMEQNEIKIEPECILEFDSGMTRSQKKRCNRYSEMGVFVSKSAILDGDLEIQTEDKTRVGTVFTTGFGPLRSSLEFANSVVEGDYEFCSPTVFANSVNNACVGHICMSLGLKGVSTMLMGSNNLEYSSMLLNSRKADYILTGAIEEYCAELWSGLIENNQHIKPKEGAVAFLTTDSEICNQAYCDIVFFKTGSLGAHPLFGEIDSEAVNSYLLDAIKEVNEKYKIDACFTASNGTEFDQIELELLGQVFGNEVIIIDKVKEIFGETMGAAFNINVMAAALCIKNNKLPKIFQNRCSELNQVLVTGYDISGNYMLAVLQRHE